MKKTAQAWSILTAIMIISCVAACVTQPTNTATTNTPTATPTATSTPLAATSPTPVTSDAGAHDLPVTLPVLDAMLTDESFASTLKTKLQLTDQQVSELRTVAREATSRLRETATDDYSGTTVAASAQAAEQIKEVVGEEKAQQLATLVRERWNTGEGGESGGLEAGSANAVPGSAEGVPAPNAVPSDTRVVVNTPAYRMDVFEGGKLVQSYKISIGYPEFPIPVGLRKALAIIYNPTWTPPDEPWVESSDKVKALEKVAAGSKLNPLGPIKIPIGSPSLIHGGKAAAKLGGFASHGCVGLTDPQVQDFARLLAQLSGTELTDTEVAQYTKTKTETKNVKLDRSVPVELRYETIVVENGKLRIYRDVYDRGSNTEENLRSVLGAYGVTPEQLSEKERAVVSEAIKQMSRDATGKPVEAPSVAVSAAPPAPPAPPKP